MNNREEWNSLSSEEQEVFRKERREKKKAARALNELKTLTSEEEEFIKQNLPLPGNQRKKLKQGKNKKKKNWQEKYTLNSKTFLEDASQTIVNSPRTISLDVEQFMYNSRILEVGITIVENGVVTPKHYIIKEHYKYRNKTNVCNLDDNKDGFIFESTLISINELHNVLIENIKDSLIVGHAFENDIKMLDRYFDFSKNEVLDTQHIAKYFRKDPKQMALSKMLTEYDIKHEGLHNAGNDAYYTLMVMYHMLSINEKGKLDGK